MSESGEYEKAPPPSERPTTPSLPDGRRSTQRFNTQRALSLSRIVAALEKHERSVGFEIELPRFLELARVEPSMSTLDAAEACERFVLLG